MAGINFSQIPSTNRVPGIFAEVDNSGANTGQVNQKTLLIGQMLSSGTAVPNIPVIATGLAAAKAQFGIGSMLADMYKQYRVTDPVGEVWFLPMADNSAGTVSHGTVTFGTVGTATDATASGTLFLYVAGVSIQVPVTAGETNTAIAAATAAAINLAADLPVAATAATNVVTLTSKHKGIAAMDTDLRLNFRGSLNSEATPAGVTVVIVPLSGGTDDPDISVGLANLSDAPFDFICLPYTGSANLDAFDLFIGDAPGGRWSYTSEIFGGGWSAKRGSFSDLVTFGTSRNDQHTSILGYFDSPSPVWAVAADYCAACAASLRADPALPLGGAGDGVTMNWLAPPIASRFTFSERNSLLYDGVSTFLVEQGDRVRVEYSVTTYQTNGIGEVDDSYLDTETLYTLQFLIRDLRIDLSTKFARKKLVFDGTRISYGTNFVTSQTVRGETIAWYNKNAALGLCQNPSVFAQTATAENQGNGQVALYLPIDVANQLRQIKMLVAFQKS